MSKGFSEKEIEFVLDKSESICKELNKVFGEQLSGLKQIQMGVAYYAAARFAAQFIYDFRPAMGEGFEENFKATIDNILQAYEDEGPDKTSRILKFVHGGEDN
jgi:hypothetical protein